MDFGAKTGRVAMDERNGYEIYCGKFELQEGTIIEINLKKKQTTVDYGDEILTSDEEDINTVDDALLGDYQCIIRIEELSSGWWKMRYDVKNATKLISMQPYNPK